jgi:signal peptidase
MNRSTVVRGLGLLVLLAVVIPFVIYAVPGVIGAEHSFVVLTGSMAPAIQPGDVVIVDETDPGAVGTGDVITFVREGSETPVTHRVVGVQGEGADRQFETKGDANEDVDASTVPAGNVLGTVLVTIPYIGYVIQAVNSREGFLLLVAIPIGLLIVTELWSLLAASRGASQGGSDAEADGSATTGASTAAATDSDATAVDSDAATATGAAAGGDRNLEATTAVEEPDEDVVLTENDLQLSTGVLVLVTPYCVYIAWELQTSLSIAVAFAAVLSTLAIGGAMVSMRLSGGESDEDDGTDVDPEADSDGSNETDEARGADGTPEIVDSGTGGTDGAGSLTDGGDPAGSDPDPESAASIDGATQSTEAKAEDRVEIPVENGAQVDESAVGAARDTTARNGEDQK